MARSTTYPKNYINGEYAVGTSCFTVVDEARDEVLGPASGKRKISVRMYYPVDRNSVAGKHRTAVLSDRKYESIKKSFHIKNFSQDDYCADYYENADIVSNREFPLIMFSMGYNAYVESNTYLLCSLASSGYVIASVGHAYEAVENDYEDGSFDCWDKAINKKMYSNIISALRKQRKISKAKVDERGALELFEKFQNECVPYLKGRVPQWQADMEKALSEVKVRFADSIDLARGVGATGHSFGGCQAYNLCRKNPEFSCGINIDGGVFGEYSEEPMTKPFCTLSCRANINVETRGLVNSVADTYHVVFDDIKHIGFTDAKFFMPGKMLTGTIDSDEMFKHLVYCHKTFFDKYLKGVDVEFTGLPSNKVSYRKI